MRTELKDVSAVHKEITVEIDAAEVRPVYQKVVQQYSRLASVPGFRKGNAPADIVKTRFRDDIKNDVLRDVINERLPQVIEASGLQPLSEPQLHIDDADNLNVSGNQNINLHVHIEVMPQVETPNYAELEAVRRVRPVDDNEIEKFIEDRRREQASLTPVEDRAAETGDVATVDIVGTFVDDAQAEPINVEGLEIELGSEGVQQEFSENLIGANVDEARVFAVNYPADFSSPGLAGKTVQYTATVKSVGRVELPEVNDEFAKSLSEGEENYETLADVRQKLRQDLETVAKVDADNRVREDLMNQLIDKNPIDVPPSIVNYQAQGLTRQFAQNMEQQGIDMRQADDKLWQMLFQRMLPQAEREVRGALLLDKIAEVETVEVSADEINGEYETIARYSQRTPDEVRELIAKEENGEQNVTERLRNRKTIEVLVTKASITDGEWQEEQPDAHETAIENLINDEMDETEATDNNENETSAT